MNTNIVTAHVDLTANGVPRGTLNMSWNDADYHAIASVQGRIDGVTLRTQGIAP